jgi:hypothetical protein
VARGPVTLFLVLALMFEIMAVFDSIRSEKAEQWQQRYIKWPFKTHLVNPLKCTLYVRECFSTLYGLLRTKQHCILTGKSDRGMSVFLLWLTIRLMLEDGVPDTDEVDGDFIFTSEAPVVERLQDTVPRPPQALGNPQRMRPVVVAYIHSSGDLFLTSKDKPCRQLAANNYTREVVEQADYVVVDNAVTLGYGKIATVLACDVDSSLASCALLPRVYFPPATFEEVRGILVVDAAAADLRFAFDVFGGNLRVTFDLVTTFPTPQSVNDIRGDEHPAGSAVRTALGLLFPPSYTDPANPKYVLTAWAYRHITEALSAHDGTGSTLARLFREQHGTASLDKGPETYASVFMGVVANLLGKVAASTWGSVENMTRVRSWGSASQYDPLITLLQTRRRDTWCRVLYPTAGAEAYEPLVITLTTPVLRISTLSDLKCVDPQGWSDGACLFPTQPSFPLIDMVVAPETLIQLSPLKRQGTISQLDEIATAFGQAAEDPLMVYVVPNDQVRTFTAPKLSCKQVVIGHNDVATYNAHSQHSTRDSDMRGRKRSAAEITEA